MPATYTVKQVSKLLGYSTNSIYTFLKEKRLKGVRIGKGRFRIPKSEIERFTQLEKGASLQLVASPSKGTAEVAYVDSFEDVTRMGQVEVPGLFDWFIGVSSIILGASWMIFSQSYLEFPVQMYLIIIPMLRGVLVTAGIGVILTDIVGVSAKGWNRVFHGILTVSYASISAASFWYGSTQNGIVFGVLALLQVGLIVLHKRSILLFLIAVYANALAISYLFPIRLGSMTLTFGVAALLVLSFLAALYGLTHKKTALLHISLIPCIASLIVASVLYAQAGMWSKTLFMLFSALLSVFIPVWNTLTFSHSRDRSFVFGVIGSILCIFVFTAGGVRLIQLSIVSQYSRELNDKLMLSKLTVEKTFALSYSSVDSFSKNKQLIDSLEKKQYSTVADMSKSVVSGNSYVQSIRIINPDGSVVSSYPHSSDDVSSFSTLPSISKAISTKKPVIIEQPSKQDVSMPLFVLTFPIQQSKSDIVGVVESLVDMDAIIASVGQIADESQQQEIRIADQQGTELGNSGVRLLQTDPLAKAIAGASGLVSAYAANGEEVIAAVGKTNTSVPLYISIQSPMNGVLQMKEISPKIISFLLLMNSGSIALFFISHRKRKIREKDTS